MKTIEYAVVYSSSRQTLVDLVNRATGEGWSPQGGIAVASQAVEGEQFFQAMVRVGPKKRGRRKA